MDRLKNILVAVDFSPCSYDAFRQAARMAEWSGASLTAVHAVNVPQYVPLADLPAPMPTSEALIARARRRWTEVLADCPAHDRTPIEFKSGVPRDVILEAVNRIKPEVLVVGAHSRLERGRPMGTTATACVQRAASKVVVVREGQSGPFGRILACVDFSDTSLIALEQAVRLAAQDNAELLLLHVYTDPWNDVEIPEGVRVNMPDFADRYRKAVEEHVRTFAAPLSHELNALKATYHGQQSPNHAEGIIAFAQTHGCDLVVLGTRGKWNLRDHIFGSTAERVARDCPCSVLAVKPRGFEQAEPYRVLGDSQTIHHEEEAGARLLGVLA